MKFIKPLSIALILLLFTACEKEGPRGPEGNANVLSGTYTISNWSYSEPSFVGDFIVPDISEDIIQNGATLVYVETGEGTFSQLPLTFYQSDSYSTSLEVITMLQRVQIIWTDSDLTTPLLPPALNFNVVTIAASTRLAHPELDFSNYKDIVRTFELE